MARPMKTRLRLRLFHAPYVDEAGMDRMRLSGVLSGADLDTDRELIDQVKAALVKCAEESTVLVVTDDITVSWL